MCIDMGVKINPPWKSHKGENPTACKLSFNQEFPTEFRPSQIPDCGNGWWALVDIPKGTRLRRVAVDNGTLFQFTSEKQLNEAGWDITEAVNYGIAHKTDPGIFFLNPGTACNHADPSREVSVVYHMGAKGVMEIWTTKDVKAGEEM